MNKKQWKKFSSK